MQLLTVGISTRVVLKLVDLTHAGTLDAAVLQMLQPAYDTVTNNCQHVAALLTIGIKNSKEDWVFCLVLRASGANYRQAKVAKWLRQSRGVRRIINSTPSAKVVSSQAFKQHIAHNLQHHSTVSLHFYARRYKTLRWCTYIRRQRAMANMCSVVTGNSAATVVAFGNGDLPTTVKAESAASPKASRASWENHATFLKWMSTEQAGCVVLAMMRMACQAWDLFQLAQVPPERQYKLSCVYMNKIVDALATGNSACPHSHFVDMVETPIMHSSL